MKIKKFFYNFKNEKLKIKFLNKDYQIYNKKQEKFIIKYLNNFEKKIFDLQLSRFEDYTENSKLIYILFEILKKNIYKHDLVAYILNEIEIISRSFTLNLYDEVEKIFFLEKIYKKKYQITKSIFKIFKSIFVFSEFNIDNEELKKKYHFFKIGERNKFLKNCKNLILSSISVENIDKNKEFINILSFFIKNKLKNKRDNFIESNKNYEIEIDKFKIFIEVIRNEKFGTEEIKNCFKIINIYSKYNLKLQDELIKTKFKSIIFEYLKKEKLFVYDYCFNLFEILTSNKNFKKDLKNFKKIMNYFFENEKCVDYYDNIFGIINNYLKENNENEKYLLFLNENNFFVFFSKGGNEIYEKIKFTENFNKVIFYFSEVNSSEFNFKSYLKKENYILTILNYLNKIKKIENKNLDSIEKSIKIIFNLILFDNDFEEKKKNIINLDFQFFLNEFKNNFNVFFYLLNIVLYLSINLQFRKNLLNIHKNMKLIFENFFNFFFENKKNFELNVIGLNNEIYLNYLIKFLNISKNEKEIYENVLFLFYFLEFYDKIEKLNYSEDELIDIFKNNLKKFNDLKIQEHLMLLLKKKKKIIENN
jgi:hypothetical protein